MMQPGPTPATYLGKPCIHGHVGRRWLRTGKCADCHHDRMVRWRAANPERTREHNRRYRASIPHEEYLDGLSIKRKSRAKGDNPRIGRPRRVLTTCLILLGVWLAGPAFAQRQPAPFGAPSVAAAALGAPASLVGNAHFTSACVPSSMFRAFDAFAALAGAATLQVQRYADAACLYPAGVAIPSTALALAQGARCPGSTYCGDAGANDGLPFLGLKVTVTDTSGSTNAITAVVLTQGAE